MRSPAVVDIYVVRPVQLYLIGIGEDRRVSTGCDKGGQDGVSLPNLDVSRAVFDGHCLLDRHIAKDPEGRCREAEARIIAM
jgi:hypothetical protein